MMHQKSKPNLARLSHRTCIATMNAKLSSMISAFDEYSKMFKKTLNQRFGEPVDDALLHQFQSILDSVHQMINEHASEIMNVCTCTAIDDKDRRKRSLMDRVGDDHYEYREKGPSPSKRQRVSNEEQQGIEIPLIGIAIGQYQDFWDCNQDASQPKIVLNKDRDSIDLNLKNMHGFQVTLSIQTHEIESLYIPQHPEYFEMDDLAVNPATVDALEEDYPDLIVKPFIKVLFIRTKHKLQSTEHQWLSQFYDPENHKNPRNQRIALFIGHTEYIQFTKMVLNRTFRFELTRMCKHIEYVICIRLF